MTDMPPTQNSSFIPKQSGTKVARKTAPRRLFIGTIIIRIVFFAVLIAAIVLFVYDRRLNTELTTVNQEINQQVASFDREQMQAILAFDNRLKQLEYIFDNTFSMHSLILLLAENTLQTVRIKDLEVTRERDNSYKAVANMTTELYDSVILQREQFAGNSLLASSVVTDVKRNLVPTVRPDGRVTESDLPVTFKAELMISRSALPLLESAGLNRPLSPVGQSTAPVQDVFNDDEL